MKALLDTHALLWFLSGDPRMSDLAREFIASEENEILLSIASLWEIAIKLSLGRLELHGTFDEVIPTQLSQNSIEILGLEVRHVARVATLEFHHRDPFDRMIVAQALVEGLPVITVDPVFDAYSVERLW